MTGQGYESGAIDAQIGLQLRKDKSDLDVFSFGPQLHNLEGVVLVTPMKFEVGVAKGHFYIEALWDHSLESDIYVQHFGLSTKPIC